MISRKKLYLALGILLIGIISILFYIYDGFEIFSPSGLPEKKALSYYNFKRFSKLFDFTSLPYSVELRNFQLDTKGLKILDTNYVLNFIEKKINKETGEDNYAAYNYYAVNSFHLYDDLLGCLVMKTSKNGSMFAKYIVKMFDNEGNYKGQIFLAEYFGDCKYLSVKEGKIYPGAMVSIAEKGIIFSNNCDSIVSIISISSKDYQVSSAGTLTPMNK